MENVIVLVMVIPFGKKIKKHFKKNIFVNTKIKFQLILKTVPDKRVIWNGPGGSSSPSSSDGLYLVELKEHVGVIYRNTTEVHID